MFFLRRGNLVHLVKGNSIKGASWRKALSFEHGIAMYNAAAAEGKIQVLE